MNAYHEQGPGFSSHQKKELLKFLLGQVKMLHLPNVLIKHGVLAAIFRGVCTGIGLRGLVHAKHVPCSPLPDLKLYSCE